MKENKKGSRVTIVPAVLWCICLLLLSGCSGTEEGTWKQEYENCMAAMEQGISEHRVSGEPELSDYEGKARNWSAELWQESLEAFSICVQRCIENQSESMGGEEDIYRNAVLLMTAVCESRGGAYEFAFVQEEDPQKAQEDFQAVIGRENPIDESIASFQEDFDIYYYGDILIAEKLEQAWQEEFYHCLDLVRDRVRRSDAADREQILEALEAWEDFFEIWAEVEWKYRRVEFRCEIMINTEEILEWLRTGGELSIWQGESRAEVFRTGTLLLIDGLERSGGSYEFLYDGEEDRQELTELLGIRPDTEEGTWKQEYEICLAAMESEIARYDVTGAYIPYEYLPDYDKWASDRSKKLWRDALGAFDECVAVCAGNHPGGRGGAEDVYRTAVLLMKVMGESRNGHYTFAHGHGEDLERAQEDFQAVIERENPIDEWEESFYEEFGGFYGADFIISARIGEAWQEEFYHCLNAARDRVRQSDPARKQQLLELLEALEYFLEIWAEDEGQYHFIESGTGMNVFIEEDRAKVFRIGTLLLIDGMERSGGSYEFFYDGETDRQALTHRYRETETVTREERGNHYMGSVDVNVGFSARQGTMIEPGEEGPEEDVPEDLLLELLAALQNDTLEDFLAGVSADYTPLREDEAMEYMREEASGILESCYYDYMEEGGEWFLFGRDNGIIVRQKTGYEKYPYCYYMFPCEGKLYGPAIRVYGKNEDYWFIGWEDNDYLVVTRREEGQVEGIAVYLRYRATQSQWQSNRRPEGWAVGLDKTHDGEIRMTFYPYHNEGSYFWGRFLNY